MFSQFLLLCLAVGIPDDNHVVDMRDTQVRLALVRELNTPKQLNELEAWSLVEKAIRNSIYNSQEEFSKLPPLVQKAVGSPNVLRLWAADGSYSEQVACWKIVRAAKKAELIYEKDKEAAEKQFRTEAAKHFEKAFGKGSCWKVFGTHYPSSTGYAEFINQITALIKKWNVVDQGNEILKDFHGYR